MLRIVTPSVVSGLLVFPCVPMLIIAVLVDGDIVV
jgi:hypothetical protein